MSTQSFYEKVKHKFTNKGENKLNYSLFSIASLNPFLVNNSSPRGLMQSAHISSALTLLEPERKIITTPFDLEAYKTASGVVVKDDVTVEEIIKRNDDITLIVRNNEQQLDLIEIKKNIIVHGVFGYENKYKDILLNLQVGDVIPANTRLCSSVSYTDNEYRFGLNVNTIIMSLPDNDEDAIIISESLSKRFSYNTYEVKTLSFGVNEVLLNTYGDENNFKGFPSIGSTIRDDGLLMATRSYDDYLGPALLDVISVLNVNPIFDNCVYTNTPNGVVSDIQVIKNERGSNVIVDEMRTDLDVLLAEELRYNEHLIKITNMLQKRNSDITLSNTLHNALVHANVIKHGERLNVGKTSKQKELPLYTVKVTIKFTNSTGIGGKLSGLSGDKGVIVDVWKDENMPINEHGVRADMIQDPKSTSARANPGRLLEKYVNGSTREVKRMITEQLSKNSNDNGIIDAFKTYLEFVKLFGNEQYAYSKHLLDTNNYEEISSILQEVVDRELYVFHYIGSEKTNIEIIYDISKSRFKPYKGHVSYIYDGERKISKEKMMITPLYTLLLDKIGDLIITSASAAINYFGLPVASNNKDKFPVRSNPIRAIGETEGRIIPVYGGRELVAELIDRSANPETHEEVYMNILKAAKPTNIEKLVERDSNHKLGETRPLNILRTVLRTVGCDLCFSEDKNINFYYKDKIIQENFTLKGKIND